MIDGLLASQEIGEDSYTTFIDERIKTKDGTEVSICKPINWRNSVIGFKKKKKTTPKQVDILKEDRQAFKLLVGKVKTPEESLSHPLTTIPLALAFLIDTPKQPQKVQLCNFFTEDARP